MAVLLSFFLDFASWLESGEEEGVIEGLAAPGLLLGDEEGLLEGLLLGEDETEGEGVLEGEEEEEAPVEGEEDGLAGLGVRLGLTDGVRVGLPDGDRVGLAVRDADTEGVRDGLPAAGEGLEEGEAVEPPGSVIAPKV